MMFFLTYSKSTKISIILVRFQRKMWSSQPCRTVGISELFECVQFVQGRIFEMELVNYWKIGWVFDCGVILCFYFKCKF